MRVGDIVQVIAVPAGLPPGMGTRKLFEACFGRIFRIEAVDDNGLLELRVGEVVGEASYMHAIWIEADCVKLLSRTPAAIKIAAEAVIEEIRQAFPARRQGRFLPLVNSAQGDEPLRVIEAFDDKDDWTKLASEWLDKVPIGLGSALSFLSDEAICFYIPAYLIADLTTGLRVVDPTFFLCHGFDRRSQDRKIRPQSDRTWNEYSRERWSRLSHEQAVAVVHYLEWRIERNGLYFSRSIVEALKTYWYERVASR